MSSFFWRFFWSFFWRPTKWTRVPGPAQAITPHSTHGCRSIPPLGHKAPRYEADWDLLSPVSWESPRAGATFEPATEDSRATGPGRRQAKFDAFLQEEDTSPGRGNGGGRRNVGVIFSPFCDLFPFRRAQAAGVLDRPYKPSAGSSYSAPRQSPFTRVHSNLQGLERHNLCRTPLLRSPPGSDGVTLL